MGLQKNDLGKDREQTIKEKRMDNATIGPGSAIGTEVCAEKGRGKWGKELISKRITENGYLASGQHWQKNNASTHHSNGNNNGEGKPPARALVTMKQLRISDCDWPFITNAKSTLGCRK